MTDGTLKRYAPLGLALGLGGLLVAAALWLIQRRFDAYVQSSLAVAALGFALALLLSPGTLQTWLGGRQARYGGNVTVMVLAFIGIVVIVNYLAYQNPRRWDYTEERSNTLAPETLEALKQLPQPAQAVGFYSTNFASARQQAEDLLKSYEIAAGGKFSYEFYDPLGDPARAREYGITRDGTLVVLVGDEREELSFATEQEITGALVRFAHPGTRVIYFLTGHGEIDPAETGDAGLSKVADLLKRQNYEVRPLNLLVTTTVPADARALVIAGPRAPVSAAETEVIATYLRDRAGASLLALLDPAIQTQTDPAAPEPLVDYLRSAWGVDVRQDLVIDYYNSFPNQPVFPLNSGYESSPITQKLQGISTLYPVARSLNTVGTAESLPGVTYTPLVKTDPRAWGETDFDSLNSDQGPVQDPADAVGPLTLALAAENSTSRARIVVFGDSDFAANSSADQGANSQMFANSLNWVTTEESLINLTPKAPITRSLLLTDAITINIIFLVTVIVMPLLVLVLGGAVWFMRRRHV